MKQLSSLRGLEFELEPTGPRDVVVVAIAFGRPVATTINPLLD